jgi:hypothetical protein
MTEAKVVSADSHENFTGTKNTIKSLVLPPLICVFCVICGFKFGV